MAFKVVVADWLKSTVWLPIAAKDRGHVKMNASPLVLVDVPPAVVTMTLTVPTASAGAIAVICVAELTVKLLAAVLPNITAVAPVKLAPVMTTDVPPASGPKLGLSVDTTGAATKTN